MKKILLIINPKSGFGQGKLHLPKIKNFFENKKIMLDIFETKRPKDATAEAKRSKNRYDIIIAAGGDGTINEVVNGIVGGRASLGIIPLGTANALAYNFGIPNNVEAACKIISTKKPKKIDIGVANGHYFALCCGVGFDGKVVHDINTGLKQKIGTFLFYFNIIKNLFKFDLPELRIIVDGKITNGYTVIVSNSKYYGGRFVMSQDAKIDDGLLDIIIFEKNSPLPIIQAVLSGHIFGRLLKFDEISHYQGKNISIKSTDRISFVQADGESLGITPVNIRVLHKKLGVIY